MKVLYTAFKGKTNSSKILLDQIKSDNKIYLTNSFEASVKELIDKIKSNEYDLIIAFGQAPIERNTIKIETTARGEECLITDYDFKNIKNNLEKKYNVVISNDAGNYLCNNIYYNGLKYIKDNSLKTKMLFIHIPKINNMNNIEDLGDLILLDKKSIRKAVRTYLIRDNKVLVIQYKQKYVGYYNIPGGKIENNESSEQASIREFKEETGIDIIKQHYVGKCVLEFSDRIFDFDVYYVDEYDGKPLDFFDNKTLWVDLEKIQKESKILASIRMIKYIKDNMNLKMFCDDEDNIIKIVDLNKDDKNE